jgi:hypothetical protein
MSQPMNAAQITPEDQIFLDSAKAVCRHYAVEQKSVNLHSREAAAIAALSELVAAGVVVINADHQKPVSIISELPEPPVKSLKTYILGNFLRGCYEGEFETIEAAWEVLSAKMLRHFPCKNGLYVLMWVREDNRFGLPDTLRCREGYTSLKPVDDERVQQCRTSFHRG